MRRSGNGEDRDDDAHKRKNGNYDDGNINAHKRKNGTDDVMNDPALYNDYDYDERPCTNIQVVRYMPSAACIFSKGPFAHNECPAAYPLDTWDTRCAICIARMLAAGVDEMTPRRFLAEAMALLDAIAEKVDASQTDGFINALKDIALPAIPVVPIETDVDTLPAVDLEDHSWSKHDGVGLVIDFLECLGQHRECEAADAAVKAVKQWSLMKTKS
eukprot:GHVO01035185.1.p1 GENE.GHVO01035185.1~~GHVO01035185.1.p1  ORF type:complete len:215 (+),score=37.09 GHVO01035185.1:321-965(+)